MNIGIIGYGSMGKMLAEKFLAAGIVQKSSLFIANRTQEKLHDIADRATVCPTNADAARQADFLFVCVRPGDIKCVLAEVAGVLKKDALLISLNGSVSFAQLERILAKTAGRDRRCRIAKVIPSVTAEINRSQTLVCYTDTASEKDRQALTQLLGCMGRVIELPENELGMGSELVSCMPGFIAAMFDVVCRSAQKHTAIPSGQIVQMVLQTVSATSELMLTRNMTFEDVVARVATKGGITEEGSKVLYELFPEAADLLFAKTLEKRRLTAQKAAAAFEQDL